MIQPPSLQLRDISLSRTTAAKHSVAAVGDVIRDETPVMGVPPFRLGVGQAVAVPPAVTAAFADYDITVEEADFGLWLETVNDNISNPVWYGVFTPEGMELFGIHTLQVTALSLPDTFGSLDMADLQLRVALQVRGMTVQRALLVVAGQAQGDLELGPISVEGLDVRFGLHIDIANLASLSAVLDDPESILDAAFTGRFAFAVDGQKLTIVDEHLLSIDDASLRFGIAVSSLAGERELLPGDTVFSLQATTFQLLGTTLSHLELACGYEADHKRVFMGGSADTSLPSLFDNILDSSHPSTGTDIRSAFAFEHTPTNTELTIALDHLYLDPAINFLELSARDLHLGFRYESDQWELKLSGATCQSWSRIARRMAEAQIVRMPGGDDLPDLEGHLDFTLSDSGSRFRYRLDFLEPDTGCRTGVVPVPFSGPLGPLPIDLANSHLDLEFGIDSGASPVTYTWSFSGGGELSTTGWLHDMLPLDQLRFHVQAYGESGDVPELLFKIDSGIPSLKLPPLLPNNGEIEIFKPETLSVRVGDTLTIEGTATIPADGLAGQAVDLVTQLGLSEEWTGLFEPISALLTGMEASLAVRVPITEDGPATLKLTLEPTDAPRFRLMEMISGVIAAGQPTQDIDETRQIAAGEEHEFFEVQPGKIEFVAAFADSFSLSLSLSFDCKVFGETFDLTALLRLVDGEPELVLMAGLFDPIRLTIPGIKPEDVLGAVDINRLIDDYNLGHHFSNPPVREFFELFPYASGGNAAEAMQALEGLFRDLFASPGVDTSLVFEIRNFGLRVRLDQAPSISGTVRLVQLPGFLDLIMPENGFDFGLGCSAQRIFISVKGPGADDPELFDTHTTDPLFSVPLGRDAAGPNRWVHLYFGRFELEFSWVTQAFGFVLDAAVVPQPANLFDFNVAGSGIYIPAQKTFIKLSKMVSTGHIPIIIPEWAISYKREGIGTEVVETAADEMGVQYYLGNPLDTDERFATLYFRETRFSPSYYIMQPGLTIDGGFVVGSHRPRDYRYDTPASPPARYDEMFEDFIQPSDKLRAHVEINNWQFILIHGSLGLMLNPLAVLAPGSPMPPFWISPMHALMGDVFADRISLSVNVPNVLFFGLSFTRPLPTLSLEGMMELTALAMTGFSETIPHTSELRRVYYATLDISAELPLLASLSPIDPDNTPRLTASLEANIVDVINGVIQLLQAVQETIQNGQELVDRLQADPSLLVRMIPAQTRRFELNVSHDELHFELGGSLYVLAPDEFEEELILYHENKRMRRGLAASNPHGARGNRIRVSAESGAAPLTVDFTIADTSDTILEFAWDFGDGGKSTNAKPTHTFANPGSYSVTLRTKVKLPDGEASDTVSTIAVIATGSAVNNQPLQLVETVTEHFEYIANPLGYFDPAEKAFQIYLQEKTEQATDQRKRDYSMLDSLHENREVAISQFADSVWSQIKETRVGDKTGRQVILHQYNLDSIAPHLESVVTLLVPAGFPSIVGTPQQTKIQQVPMPIQNIIKAQFVHLVREELTKSYTITLGLDQSPYDLAAAIVGNTVLNQPVTLPFQPVVVRPMIGVDMGSPGTEIPGIDIPISVSINASQSGDSLNVEFSATILPGGHPVEEYNWHFGDGATSTESSPSHTYYAAGDYTVKLYVKVDGKTLHVQHSIYVSAAPLIMKLTASPNSGTAPLTVQFIGHYGSNIMNVTWDFGDDTPPGYGLHPKYTYTTPGTYTATATATNTKGDSHSAAVTVVVNQPPPLIKGIAANPTIGLAPLAVQFSVETDSNATITGYAWSFGDDSNSNETSPLHTYIKPGSYTATVIVSASDGRTESSSVIIVVNMPASIVKIVNKNDRIASYTTHLPEEILRGVIAPIEDCLTPWIEKVENGEINTDRQAATLRLTLNNCIASAIGDQYRVITDNLTNTNVLDIPEREIRQKLADALKTTPNYVHGARNITLYDGGRTRNLLTQHVATDREPGPGIESVPQARYEIRCRPELVPAGETPTLATVPTSAPIYKVVSEAEQYYLLVEENDNGRDEMVLLPDWITDGILPSPLATDLIRARLGIEQVIVQRRLTDAERAYTNHAFVEEDDRLYQQSVFARPEYTLREKGGIHGPLCIADLLVKDGGGYVVPPSPLWLSGLKIKLLESLEIGMAGLLAAPDNLFLNGYHELSLPGDSQKTKLVLKGEFHLITGAMWKEALKGNSEFQADSFHFNGSAEFWFDNRTIFKGQTSGTIRIPGKGKPPIFDLSVNLEYHNSWTLEFNDVELIKVTMDAIFDMDVDFNPNVDPQFAIKANGDLGLSVQLAIPSMKEVVITPATTICSWVPIVPPRSAKPYFRLECVTLPAIKAQVPDLANMEWVDIIDADVQPGLSIESGDNGNSLEIKLHIAFKFENYSISETREILLADLLN